MEVSVRPLWVNSGRRDELRECPLYPQKRTLPQRKQMSALCHKRTYAVQQRTSLLDRLIGGARETQIRLDRSRPKSCRVVSRHQEKQEPMDCDVHSP